MGSLWNPAIACILRKKQDVALYVDECYKQASYLSAYALVISPIPGPDQWLKVADTITIKPHLHKMKTGRPTKNRTKEPSEKPPATTHGGKKLGKWVSHRPYTCQQCGHEGHTKRTYGNGGSTSQSTPTHDTYEPSHTTANTLVTTQATQEPNHSVVNTSTLEVGMGMGRGIGRGMGGGKGMVSNSQPTPQVQMVQGCIGVTSQVVPSQSQSTNKRYKSPAKRGKPWKP
ncbi:uncharacterized protein LOC126626686 isoform X1 [Malus sylvestris]|uniref:uncharacterized protein LOC126626686 isoform X1 n=1 Tax=Malus sylvestris TaxID=3752 RepID=UPI0021AD2E4E|nr:uncharacterized protein LOC126626686 isoform X1 [Malus sylvestris]